LDEDDEATLMREDNFPSEEELVESGRLDEREDDLTLLKEHPVADDFEEEEDRAEDDVLAEEKTLADDESFVEEDTFAEEDALIEEEETFEDET